MKTEETKIKPYSSSAKFKAGIAVVLSTLYLLNLSFGLIEIPDNLPIIGNLDEFAASLILVSSLKVFGVDWTNVLPFLNRRKSNGN